LIAPTVSKRKHCFFGEDEEALSRSTKEEYTKSFLDSAFFLSIPLIPSEFSVGDLLRNSGLPPPGAENSPLGPPFPPFQFLAVISFLTFSRRPVSDRGSVPGFFFRIVSSLPAPVKTVEPPAGDKLGILWLWSQQLSVY